MMEWKPINDDAKRIVRVAQYAYGRFILGATIHGVLRLRWWQTHENPERGNFLGDCGNAYFPTHYMELPEPPK